MKPRTSLTVTDKQLPMWPRDTRGIPNAFARGALFNVANLRAGTRKNLKRHRVATLQNIVMDYTGEQLRQDDEDVFMEIVNIAREQDLGSEVQFTAHSMITSLEWTKNSASYRRLADCLDRMKASSLTLTVENKNGLREAYSGSLIRAFRWKEEEGAKIGQPLTRWRVLLEPEIVSLFAPQSYSRVDWTMRLQLSPLEKWLHSFYHTHQQPYNYSVENLHRLTGSEIPVTEIRKFRYKLRKALGTLVDIQFFASAVIDPASDLVRVVRNQGHTSIVQR